MRAVKSIGSDSIKKEAVPQRLSGSKSSGNRFLSKGKGSR